MLVFEYKIRVLKIEQDLGQQRVLFLELPVLCCILHWLRLLLLPPYGLCPLIEAAVLAVQGCLGRSHHLAVIPTVSSSAWRCIHMHLRLFSATL